jgi:hypothetical protein
MSSMSLNEKGRRLSFRPAGADRLPSLEALLTTAAVIAAFAMLTCILLGVIR